MDKLPAIFLYTKDWSQDMEEHSLEIEGAWIRITCKLSQSDTRGQATKSLEQWSRILREKEKKSEEILKYLLNNHISDGVYLDNQNITIISRRMVRDEQIRQIRKEVGRLGGNPELKKKRKNLVNQKSNQKSTKTHGDGNEDVISNKKKEKIIFSNNLLVISKEKKELYQSKFPAIKLDDKILEMEAWLIANPKNKKTNYDRFIVNWLSREQDRARPLGNGNTVQDNKPPVPTGVKARKLICKVCANEFWADCKDNAGHIVYENNIAVKCTDKKCKSLKVEFYKESNEEVSPPPEGLKIPVIVRGVDDKPPVDLETKKRTFKEGLANASH